MASTPGKRKRKDPDASVEDRAASVESSASSQDTQAVFRRHFETHFEPLPKVEKTVPVTDEFYELESAEESDWEGISEDGDDGRVEIMEHTILQSSSSMSREELKAFMSSKPPTDPLLSSEPGRPQKVVDEDDLTEAANIKNDLALQRLLTESHLLDPDAQELHGTNRHKAIDLRLQKLGAKTSIFRQEKMPMSFRVGMMAKQAEREEKRRREARENGIVLEKERKNGKERRRDRGVGGPGVGKFAGGMLRLSKRDVIAIEGPRRTSSSSRGRGARGRGRGGKRGKH